MNTAFGVDEKTIELYARANSGPKAQKMINVLSKTHGFISAFKDKVGQEVMLDALQRSEEILDKIVDETATPQERAEFRALKKIIARWQKIWAVHNEALNELKKQ
jgi:methionyl-tRNA synthetase